MQLRTFLATAVAAAAALAFTAAPAAAQNYKSEYRMSLVLGTAFPLSLIHISEPTRPY